MSTKIYNGYTLPKMTFEEITLWHQLLFEKTRLAHKNFCLSYYARMVTLEIDLITLGIKEKPKRWNVLPNLEHQLYDMVKEKTVFNLESSIVYFPIKDKTLCMYFGEFKSEFLKCTEVKFYGYWDNVDPDASCSEEEWSQRKLDWESVINDTQSPSSRGLCSLLTESKAYLIHDYSIQGKEMLALIPTLNERLINIKKSQSFSMQNLTDQEIKEKLKDITSKMITKGEGVL